MKKHLQILSGLGLAIIIFCLGMILISAMTGCTAKINLPTIAFEDVQPLVTATSDTVWRLDTVPYLMMLRDSVPCPPGRDNDSTVYVTFTKYLPGQQITKTITIRDTVRITTNQTALPAPGEFPTAGSSWGERIAWLGSVLLLIGALLKKRKKSNDHV